jgi:uncharacterized protein (TIGR02284 family)
MRNTEVISTLSELMQTCTDGREVFHKAAERVQNSEFRRLFNIFSQQRAQFLSELQAEIHRLDGSSDEGRTMAENGVSIHHERLSSFDMAASDEAAIIAHCEESEERAVNSYQAALKADLPLDVQYVVKRQFMDIKDAYDRIRILQRAA